MSRSKWLAVVAASGALMFVLSFVEGWIAHDREVRGEGYRFVHVVLSAWRSVAVPVLTLGALAALGTAVGAAASIWRPALIPRFVLLAGSVITLALIGSSVVPIAQDGHASSVDLSAAWLSGIGIGLASVMVVGAILVTGPGPRLVMALGILGALVFASGAGGRWLTLQLKEGTGEHWSDGSYTRAATARQPDGTLTIEDGQFKIDDRWTGTWESSGLTIVLTDDPACPESRGTYHAHGEGDGGLDLRFVKIVDTCREGARAADLEAGMWIRDP